MTIAKQIIESMGVLRPESQSECVDADGKGLSNGSMVIHAGKSKKITKIGDEDMLTLDDGTEIKSDKVKKDDGSTEETSDDDSEE